MDDTNAQLGISLTKNIVSIYDMAYLPKIWLMFIANV